MGIDWQQERLRKAFNDWRQKGLATRVLTVTQQQEIDQVRGNLHKQQPTINRNRNSGLWLVTIRHWSMMTAKSDPQ